MKLPNYNKDERTLAQGPASGLHACATVWSTFQKLYEDLLGETVIIFGRNVTVSVELDRPAYSEDPSW
jgi:hypothetical protein